MTVDVVETPTVDAVTPDRVGGSELPDEDRVGIDSGARASTSETPKVAPLDTPEIAGVGPTQNARSSLKNILPTR